MIVRRNLEYFVFCLLILLQGLIVYGLFIKSIQIDGDIVPYLKIIASDINLEYDIEPISLLLFKIIGLFPFSSHFLLLYLFICFLCVVESWIVFKNSQGSILWLFFFTIAIVPFFHAINLRTGFGMFFLFVFYKRKSIWPLIITPFFHASFAPLLLGIKFKISIKNIIIIIFLTLLLGLIMYNLVFGKLETYYSYYVEGESFLGVAVEVFFLIVFSYFLRKKYNLNSSVLWYRILFFILLIASVSFKLAVISSRFVTFAYLILLMIRLNSTEINKIKMLTINNIFFYTSFVSLILFRVYRIVTMFGFFSL